MARWRLLAGPAVAPPSIELTRAATRKISFKLREPSALSFTIDGRHQQAGELHELATDVHLLRDGAPLYTGRVGATGDDITDAEHSIRVETADTRAILHRRLWHTEPNTIYTDTEQTAVAAALIGHTQAQPGGDLGISTAGVPVTGRTVTRTIAAGATIYGELAWLASAGDPETAGKPGFDWDISPGWTGRTLQIWHPQRGEDRGVIFDFSYTGRPHASAISKVTREIDPGAYAKSLRVSGSAEGVYAWAVDPGAATAPEGLWESTAGYTDEEGAPAITTKAAQLATEMGTLAPTHTVTLRPGVWEGPDHIWLGDTVRLIVRSGRIGEDASLRVLALDLTLGESGEEVVSLTVGAAPGSLLRRIHDLERRMSQAERR